MRNVSILGLAGLLLTATLGCEMNRPYCSRCLLARNNYGQAETAYRPRTTVTMRAEEVPENPTPVQSCPTLQVVSAGASATQTIGQPSASAPIVTVTIPSIKVSIPMTAVVGNSPTPASESQAITQLPPAAVSVIHADVKTSTPAHTSSSPTPESSLQPTISVKKEEAASKAPAKAEELPIPELPPEPKPMSKAPESKPDLVRQPRLSLLPPDPPPELSGHRTPAAGSSRNSALDLPPPPPPIPKSGGSGGQAIPSADPE